MVKIKLAILEKDELYLQRLTAVFNTRFSDRLEVYSFTDTKGTEKFIKDNRIDVLLVSEDIEYNVGTLPSRCSFAYLSEQKGVDGLKGQRVICKFQKSELIYKEILSIYSEKSDYIINRRSGDEDYCRITLFASPVGGVGTSTMAAATAIRYAKMGKRTLYLCLQLFGHVESFFNGEGQGNFTDVIYAVKTKKSNLTLKIESATRKCDGVSFFASPSQALDMNEFSKEDLEKLLTEILISSSFDELVIDMDFNFSDKFMYVANKADIIAMVSDGSELANIKISTAVDALDILEQQQNLRILSKTLLIYNNFNSKTGKQLVDIPIANIGGVSRYEGYPSNRIAEEISNKDFFNKLV